MIAFAVRLVLKSGRETLLRFLVTGAAMALGVLLLLTTVGGANAVEKQNARVAWMYSSEKNLRANGVDAADPLLWSLSADTYNNDLIARIDVAATGASSPVPPGITRLPHEGEVFVSPALAKKMASVPRDQLADRFAGTVIGGIDTAVLPTAETFMAIVGHAPERFPVAEPQQLRNFETAPAVSGKPHDGGPGGFNSGRVDFVVYVIALALLFPIGVFVASSTRLAATRREQRLAAMRLVGATPAQITVIGAIESLMVAVIGVLAGIAAFYAFHDALASMPVIGTAVHGEDITLTAWNLAVVSIVVPLAAAVISAIAMSRVRVSPLGVVRKTKPRRLSSWRLLPLVGGIAELTIVVIVGVPDSSAGQERVFLPGILMLLIGLVTAGPWLTSRLAGLFVRSSNRAEMLLSARRLQDDPRAAFRAVSGVVLAVFTGTASFSVIHTMAVYHGETGHAVDSAQTLRTSTLWARDFESGALEGPANFSAVNGVTGVAMIYRQPSADASHRSTWRDPTFVICDELAKVPAAGRCAPGATVAKIDFDGGGAIVDRSSQVSMVWPAAPLTPEQLRRLPVATALVATDGTVAAKERARTAIENAYPNASINGIGDWPTQVMLQQQQYQQLSDIIIVVGMFVAGCTLAVSLAAGIIERQRAFGLLRLTGVSLSELRAVVLLETAAPLIGAVLLAVATGLLGSQLFLRAQLQETLAAPGVAYVLTLCAGVAGSLAIVCAALPMLGRTTSVESVRND